MSIIEQAKAELERINFGEEDSRVMIEILEKFFDQWDSGGAVSVVAPILQRLMTGKPLTPLLGTDDEWNILDFDSIYAQNKRCSSVMKRTREGQAFDVNLPGRPFITFPYWPEDAPFPSPVVEVEVG